MNRFCFKLFAMLAVAALVLVASPARADEPATGKDPHAAGAAAHHDDAHADHAHKPLSPMPSPKEGLVVGLTSIVVFLLVLAFLSAKVWPTIAKGLDDRAAKIRSEIEAAEHAQKQAKQALAEYEANLAKARAEAQKMLDDAKAQQTAIAADLKAKSEIELNAMREKATRDIDAAKRAALGEIYDHAASLATTMAGKILKREINSGDQQRLVQESLHELQTAVARNN